MNKKNITLLEKIGNELINSGINFYFLDKRWHKNGDVDLCIDKRDLIKFHSTLRKHKILLVSKDRTWKFSYLLYANDETISLDVHIGKYEGTPGWIMHPENINPRQIYLSLPEQMFYLLFKMAIRKNDEYLDAIEQTRKGMTEKDFDFLFEYLKDVFSEPDKLTDDLYFNRTNNLLPKFRLMFLPVRIWYFLRNQLYNVLCGSC